MSKELGREMHYEPMEREVFAQHARAGGRDKFVIQHVMEMAVDFKNGIFAGMNDVVSKVGKRSPMTVREFVKLHAEEFRTQAG